MIKALKFPWQIPGFKVRWGSPWSGSCWSKRMNANATIEEMRRELAKLKAEHEILEKSHRRLVVEVLREPAVVEQFLGQMAVDRVKLYPHWLKTSV